MGGFFGGGQQSRTKVEQDVSPEQRAVISGLAPFQIEQAGLSTELARTGTENLLAAQPSTEQGLLEALQLSGAEEALPGLTGAVKTPLAIALGGQGLDLMGAVPTSILEPLQEEFTGTVIPGIESAAIRAGAPGGGAEGDLITRAAGAYGRAATGQLAQSASQRYLTALQGLTTAGNMALAGPERAAEAGALERTLGTQRANVPMSLAQALISASQGIPGIATPFAQGGTTTKSLTTPTSESEMGSGLTTLLTLAILGVALSTEKVKEDIQPFEEDEYIRALNTMRGTPITRWRYKWETPGTQHTGPIAEMAPREIRYGDHMIHLGDYNGMLHAALKGLDRKVAMLEGVLSNA